MQEVSDNEVLTSVGVGALAVLASITKAPQWLDPATGRISWTLLASGISAALVLAMVIRALGEHYGVEPLAQAAVTGVLCYVGPDAIIKAAAAMILKRAGVVLNDGSDSKKP